MPKFLASFSYFSTPLEIEPTYGKRLRQYKNRESTIVWVGAGLAGLIGLLASSFADGAPRTLRVLVVVAVILAGGALAQARIKFQWAATTLDRAIQDGGGSEISNQDLPEGTSRAWPTRAERYWNAGRACVVVAAALYVAAVWTSPARPERSHTDTLSAPAAFLWFNRTWGRDDLNAFAREAFRHGQTRAGLAKMYLEHPVVRHVLGIAR